MATTHIGIVIDDDHKGTLTIRRGELGAVLPINGNPTESIPLAITDTIEIALVKLQQLEENPPNAITSSTNTTQAKAAQAKASTPATTNKKATTKPTPPPTHAAAANLFEF